MVRLVPPQLNDAAEGTLPHTRRLHLLSSKLMQNTIRYQQLFRGRKIVRNRHLANRIGLVSEIAIASRCVDNVLRKRKEVHCRRVDDVSREGKEARCSGCITNSESGFQQMDLELGKLCEEATKYKASSKANW